MNREDSAELAMSAVNGKVLVCCDHMFLTLTPGWAEWCRAPLFGLCCISSTSERPLARSQPSRGPQVLHKHKITSSINFYILGSFLNLWPRRRRQNFSEHFVGRRTTAGWSTDRLRKGSSTSSSCYCAALPVSGSLRLAFWLSPTILSTLIGMWTHTHNSCNLTK